MEAQPAVPGSSGFDSADFKPADFDPHDYDSFIGDPYPVYARMRELSPVHWVEGHASWWCFRYEDCKRILLEKDVFRKNSPLPPTGPIPPLAAVLSSLPQGVFGLDDPRHGEVRPLLDRLFHEAIQGIPERVGSIGQMLLKEVMAGRQFELYSAFAYPLPAIVLQQVLGVQGNDFMGGLSGWVDQIVAANDLTAPMGVKVAGMTCGLALGSYFGALSQCPAHRDTGRMMDLMAGDDSQGAQGLSHDEIQANAVNLAVAGYYSTTYLIMSGIYNLLRHPEQLQLLKDSPHLDAAAFQEMMRFDSPAQLVDRYVATTTDLGGVTLHPGDKVTAVLGSANHDPVVFENPDSFDIRRSAPVQVEGVLGLAFGLGDHHCLGAPLASQVAPRAIRVLLESLPSIQLAGTPQWQADPYLRGLTSLPIQFRP